ncbi:hypothetical protein Gpo141_00009923 [Globisporangium polare]
MVHFTRILAVLALVAVSVTADEAAAPQQPTTSNRVERHARALASASAAGSGSAAGGSGTAVGSSEITAANAAIATQWKTAKALLEKAFAGQSSLQSKLTAFSAKVDATLSGSVITLDAAKKIIAEFLTSLQSDSEYANVADKLSPILSALGISSSGSSSSTGSTVSSSKGSTANSTVTTPAPTTSGTSSSALVGVVAPVTVALVAAVFASF